MPKFGDIPQFPRHHYEIDVSWRYLEQQIASFSEEWVGDDGTPRGGLNLSPDYQRTHVWTRDQQIAYLEYQLMGGEVGRNLIFNSPDWMRSYRRPTELVDGKQRLEAVRSFLRNEVPVFGNIFSAYEDKLPGMGGMGFRFRVCGMETRKETLQLYLNINAGGTPHTQEELNQVRVLLAAEQALTPPPAKRGTKGLGNHIGKS